MEINKERAWGKTKPVFITFYYFASILNTILFLLTPFTYLKGLKTMLLFPSNLLYFRAIVER